MLKKVFVPLVAGAFVLSTPAMAEVVIKGKNQQSADVAGAVINAAVMSGAKATQNISSNKGNVTVGGDNKQTTSIKGAVINAAVMSGSKAEQNIASNDGN